MIVDVVTGRSYSKEEFKANFKSNYLVLFRKKSAKHSGARFVKSCRYDEVVKIIIDNNGREYPIVCAKTMQFYIDCEGKFWKISSLLDQRAFKTTIGALTFSLKGADFISIREWQTGHRPTKEIASERFKKQMSDPCVKNKHRERTRSWRGKNKDRIREYNNKYTLERRSKDLNFKIRMNVRSRIRRALKGKTKKSIKTEVLIGISMGEYRVFLESKFQSGMSWSNYGEWQIDHIIPCSSFDLTVDSQLRECFHYSNTQPLWKIDNLKKGSKKPHGLL
jgi:hypothetical protein